MSAVALEQDILWIHFLPVSHTSEYNAFSRAWKASDCPMLCSLAGSLTVTQLLNCSLILILSFSVNVLSFFSCGRHVAYILCAVRHNFRTFDRKTTNNFSKSYAKKLKN